MSTRILFDNDLIHTISTRGADLNTSSFTRDSGTCVKNETTTANNEKIAQRWADAAVSRFTATNGVVEFVPGITTSDVVEEKSEVVETPIPPNVKVESKPTPPVKAEKPKTAKKPVPAPVVEGTTQEASEMPLPATVTIGRPGPLSRTFRVLTSAPERQDVTETGSVIENGRKLALGTLETGEQVAYPY